MIIWIERPLAIAIHERQLAERGGGNGVRDENPPDSARSADFRAQTVRNLDPWYPRSK